MDCYHPPTPAPDLTCYDPWVPKLQVAATNSAIKLLQNREKGALALIFFLQDVKYFWVPYTIVWLIFIHILPKVGIVVMNIVIILRLKKAFARPSLQANRSQPETATTSTTNKKEVQGPETDERAKKAETAQKKALRKSETKTSLHTIHEEISTVSQVTAQWERKTGNVYQ